MNDYWICQHCKSLNRVGTGKCYRCKAKYGSEPKEVAAVRSTPPPATTPGVRPIPGSPPPAGFFTGPSVGPGVVGPGGRPVDDSDIPAYLSRPIQGPAFTSTTAAPVEQGGRLPSPAGWLKRRAAAWLAPRQSVSVWFIGYLSAGLITLQLVVAALILTTISSAIRVALQSASLEEAWAELGSGRQSAVVMMGAAFAVIALLALISFSLFVGLSTHNAGRMGVAGLKLTPGAAMTCWWKVIWAQIKLVAGFLVPAGLLAAGYHLPGLIAALVAVEFAQRSLKDPFGWISNPASHLADLYGRMSISGDEVSLVGSAWKMCFQFANALSIVAYALPVIAVAAVTAAAVAGRSDLTSLRPGGFGPTQLAFLVVGLPLLLAVSASLALLVPICIDMVERQRTRHTMTRVGQGRSWLDRPGPSAAARRLDAGAGTGPGPSSETGTGDGYESRYGYGGREFVGRSGGLVAEDGDQNRGYETRETGGYDDRGFGTGDEERGYESHQPDSRSFDSRR